MKEKRKYSLPRDYARCHVEECSNKEDCLRWITRDDGPISMRVVDVGSSCLLFIDKE